MIERRVPCLWAYDGLRRVCCWAFDVGAFLALRFFFGSWPEEIYASCPALLCSISLLVLNPNLNGDYIHSPGAIWRFWAPNGIFLRKKTRGRSFRWRSISCDSSCSCYVLFWIEALWCVSDSKVAIYLFNFFLIYGLVWIHLIRLGFFVGIWNWIRLLELVKISDFLDFERNLGAFPPSFQMKRSSSNLYSFWNCNFFSFEKMV